LRAAARPVVVAVSVLLTLAAAELALRWGGFAGESVALHARLLRHDAELGWAKAPLASVAYRWQGRRVVETSNSRGARGPERTAAVAPSRTLFLGDSFCEGYLVNDDDVFSAVLEREAGVEAINHGVVGYSTDQQLLLYRRVAPYHRSRRTVVLFFDNDVWFNAHDREHRAGKPLFALLGGELKLNGLPVPPPDPAIVAAPAAERPEQLRLLRLLEGLRARTAPTPGARAEPVNELLLYRREAPEEVEAAWALTEAILKEFKKEVRGDGGELQVFYVPTAAAVSAEAWEETRALYAMPEDEWHIGAVELRLTSVCERLKIPLISPTARLRGEMEAGRELYFRADGHWTAEGHRVVAEIFAERLH
jgi:hypothetical protein